MELTPTEMTQEQGMEIFGNLQKGKHWKGFFQVQRKDKSTFMAHVTDTPVLHDAQLKFIVGVSADYTQMHDLIENQKQLNETLEQQVQARTMALMDSQRNQRMVGAAMQQSNTGVLIADEAGGIVWSNAAAQNLLRLSQEQLQQVRPWDLPLEFLPSKSSLSVSDSETEDEPETDQQKQTKDAAVREFFQGNHHKMPMQAIMKASSIAEGDDNSTGNSSSGSSFYCHEGHQFLSISVQAMAEGNNNRMIVLRDQTVERQANEANRRADREAATSRTKTEMIQMLSHEFRTPLQGIIGVVSTVLMDMKEGDSLHESLSTIAASSRLLLTLINNVLDMGKIDAHKMEALEMSPISLLSSIRDAVMFCEPFALMNEIQLATDDISKDAMVVANKLRLEQVLINLLSNSVKYSGAGTKVQICVQLSTSQEVMQQALSAGASDVKLSSVEDRKAVSNDPTAIITIRDQGRGIPKEEMCRLFGEFSQLAISKKKDSNNCSQRRKQKTHSIGQSSGSGLGLSLVLKFVSMMNGHIWVTNGDTCGAEFHCSFPLADAPTTIVSCDKEAITSQFQPVVSPPHINLDINAGLRVLLLDDSLINLKVLKRMHERLGIRHLQIFTDGLEALSAIRQTEDSELLPSLVLSDLQMPIMDGFEFVGQLKELACYHRRQPTVVACSADWTAETQERCLGAGFDGFLRKPIDLSALRAFLVSQM